MALHCFLCVDSHHEDEASLGQHLASHHRVERETEVILALHSLGQQRRTQLVRESQEVPEKTAIKRQNPAGVDNFEHVSKKAMMKKIRKSEEELFLEVLNNPDILEQIFNHLPPEDIKTVALVSKTWREVVEKPRFWTWAVVNLNIFFNNAMEMYLENSQEKIYSRRYENIASVTIDPNRDGRGGPVTLAASPNNLAKALLDKKEVDLGYAQLESEQFAAVFTGFAKSEDLRKLVLEGVKLTSHPGGIMHTYVPADILAEAICRAECVDMTYDTYVDSQQATAIFTSITDCQDLRLKKLDAWDWIKPVPPELFASGIIRLETVYPHCATDDQMNHLFCKIAQSNDTSLKKIHFESIDLTDLPPKIFSAAVLKMEDVYLGDSTVTADQVNAVLASIVRTEHLKLKTFYATVFFDDDNEDIDLQLLSKAEERVKLTIHEYVYE